MRQSGPDGDLVALANRCVLPAFLGGTAPDWVLRWLDEGLAGVVLFARNVVDLDQLAALTGTLRADAPRILVGIDEEGGDVTRLEADRGSSSPGNAALGAADDVELTRQVAARVASVLATAGVNYNLAPVADVNSNPRNPVIGVRSFGADPALVSRHVAAFVQGTQSVGVAACAKHFPGHGDTETDSHLAVPVVRLGAEELAEIALRPFRAAISAGVRSVMLGHLRVPAVDDQVATLSGPVITGLLRDQLGFDGVIITDALEMAAVAETVGMAEGGVRAIAAGADLLCLGAKEDVAGFHAVRDALVAAVRAGRLPAERLAQAAGRVDELARWAAHPSPSVGLQDAGPRAARRALRVAGRLAPLTAPVVFELRPPTTIAVGDTAWGIGTALAEAVPGTTVQTIAGPCDDADALIAAAAGRGAVVVVRDPQRFGWQEAFLDRLLTARPDTVLVDMGWPSGTRWPAAAQVSTHGAASVLTRAVVELLAAGSGTVGDR